MGPRKLRLYGYIRVSQIRGRGGESFISPDQQRDRIAAWVTAYGHELVDVFEEFDESGARRDRPQLLKVLEAIDRGDVDGVVVAKLDRFGRSLIDGLQQIERIEAAGGVFVSVADGFDLTTDTGRLVLRIMFSLAEFELDRVRSGWNDAKHRAVMRGIHPSAVAPFGYRREEETAGALLVDPVTGPLVTEMFDRRVAGASFTELARWLTARGAKPSGGARAFSLRAARDIVRNPVYLGVAYAGESRNPDAHPALTDQASFDRAYRPGVRTVPRSEHPSLISQYLRCAGCRYTARSERRARKTDHVWLFSCKTTAGGGCEAPAHITDDGRVEDWIVNQMLSALPDFTIRVGGGDTRDLERGVDRLRVVFEQWRDDGQIQETLGMEAYLAGLTSRQEALNLAIMEWGDAQAAMQASEIRAGAADIAPRWPSLTRDDRTDLLHAAIQCVFIRRSSRRVALDERLHIVWRGESVDLPARGYRGFVMRPFPFPGDSHVEDGLVGIQPAEDR